MGGDQRRASPSPRSDLDEKKRSRREIRRRRMDQEEEKVQDWSGDDTKGKTGHLTCLDKRRYFYAFDLFVNNSNVQAQ